MNVELLRKIQAHIREEPRRLSMEQWVIKGQPGEMVPIRSFTTGGVVDVLVTIPACGTVGCIGGWAQALADDPQKMYMSYSHLLDLQLGEGSRLFYVCEWPKMFRNALNQLEPQTPEYANVVALRIDYFIDTNGRDAQ